MNILVIEDDIRVADFLSRGLRAEGYRVQLARTGPEGLQLARDGEPTLLLLDVMLPGMSGLDLCLTLRAEHNYVPILMLTSLSDVDDRVAGLRVGADDYLTKPFAFEELLARIEALLRRGRQQQPKATELRVADLVLDRERMVVARDGKPIPLTAKELAAKEATRRAHEEIEKRELFGSQWNKRGPPHQYRRRLRPSPSKQDRRRALASIGENSTWTWLSP